MPDAQFLPIRRRDAASQAVIFLHGFTGSASDTWNDFVDVMRRERSLDEWDIISVGYSSSLLPDLRGYWRNADLQTLADQLNTRLKYDLGDYQEIALIGHSMGGLVMQRAILDEEQLRGRVRCVVLFGTPSGGLGKASWVPWQQQCKDMKTDGPFITRLRTQWDETFNQGLPFRLVLIAGEIDDFVPRNSSHEPFGQYQDVERLVIPGDHSGIVQPTDENDLGYKIVRQALLRDSMPKELITTAQVIAKYPQPALANCQLSAQNDLLPVPSAVTQYALCLEEVGQRDLAIKVLEQQYSGSGDTDALGILAGRLKRRWLAERDFKDARRATDLHRFALKLAEQRDDVEQIYYHAINLAFMSLAYAYDYPICQRYAFRALKTCQRAATFEITHAATMGEANLYLGRTTKSLEFYQQAIQMKPNHQQLQSMCLQATIAADLLDDEVAMEELAEIFCVGQAEDANAGAAISRVI